MNKDDEKPPLPPEVLDSKIAIVASILKVRTDIKTVCSNLQLKDLTMFSTYRGTLEDLKEGGFDLVIVDWNLNDVNGAGLKLIEQIRADPLFDQTATAVMSAEADQSHVCNAVDTEVDAFIVKPFTGQTMEVAITNALKSRKKPSPYTVTIKDAKRLMDAKEYETAREKFNEALEMSEKPANAHYYLGFISMVENKFAEAMSHFDKGLTYRPMHLRSLYGKAFTIENGSGDIEALCDALEQVLDVFPVHANTLKKLIPLLLKRREYKKCGEYLKFMLKVRGEFPKLVDIITAYFQLIIKGNCTKKNPAYLKENYPALKALQNGREKYAKEFILLLLNYGMESEAKLEYVMYTSEYGKELEIELVRTKRLYDAKDWWKCLESCRVLNTEFGQTRKVLEMIVGCYEGLEDGKRLMEAKEDLEILLKNEASGEDAA